MNKKEPMSLSEHYNLRYTLNGVVWLIYAVINLLPNNIVTKVLCIVALIMAIITSCIALFVKADADDDNRHRRMHCTDSDGLRYP